VSSAPTARCRALQFRRRKGRASSPPAASFDTRRWPIWKAAQREIGLIGLAIAGATFWLGASQRRCCSSASSCQRPSGPPSGRAPSSGWGWRACYGDHWTAARGRRGRRYPMTRTPHPSPARASQRIGAPVRYDAPGDAERAEERHRGFIDAVVDGSEQQEWRRGHR
jgi:hypothetical protein